MESLWTGSISKVDLVVTNSDQLLFILKLFLTLLTKQPILMSAELSPFKKGSLQ
jgi:hypothetical protein